MSDTMKLCDGDCNHCPIVNHPNSRMVTKILNDLHDEFGNGVYQIVQGHCPNLTVCYDCRMDDFCHIEGCEIVGQANTEPTKTERARGLINEMSEVLTQLGADFANLREGIQ